MHFILHKDYFSAMLLRISKSEYPKEEMYATMSIEKVKAYLKDMNCPKEVLEFATSSATVELAAEAAGVIPARISKTLCLMSKEGPIVISVAGDAKIDI